MGTPHFLFYSDEEVFGRLSGICGLYSLQMNRIMFISIHFNIHFLYSLYYSLLYSYQVHADDDRRYTTIILRSQPSFATRPARDNVKVWVEEDAGRKLYFARFYNQFRFYVCILSLLLITSRSLQVRGFLHGQSR